jgi:hypothetical protein
MVTLHKVLQYRNVTYQFNHRRPLGIHALGQLLANTLYYKRFFPYYTFNLAVGLDEEGEMIVCSSLLITLKEAWANWSHLPGPPVVVYMAPQEQILKCPALCR